MKYFCVDYGSKRMGTAVSNTEGTIAFPRTVIANDDSALSTLAAMVLDERAETLVMGDARTLEGGENPVTKEAERFAEKLSARTQVPLVWAREAGSTVGAGEISGTNHDDAAAAAFILQRYLDMHTGSVE